jgi:hypothetical protein
MKCDLLRKMSPRLCTLLPRAYAAACPQLAVRKRPACLADELVVRMNPDSKCPLRAIQLVILGCDPQPL